jgi:hypothetical protein
METRLVVAYALIGALALVAVVATFLMRRGREARRKARRRP